jgi:hypothetical protein
LIDKIKSVEQNYKWIIYRLCFESDQNKNEIINTETADQIILDSDDGNALLLPPTTDPFSKHQRVTGMTTWLQVVTKGSTNRLTREQIY